ncbi:MAG: ABC transporter permease [Bacteroidota bacterium]
MIQHFFKVAWRVVTRGKKQYLLLSFGLSIGLTVAILIGYFIQHELSYENFHTNKDTLYRFLYEYKNGEIKEPIFPATFLPEVSSSLAGLEHATRTKVYFDPLFKLDTKTLSVSHMLFTDPDFFDMFSFELLEGNNDDLNQPFNIFISSNFAESYFGTIDPIGETLTYDNEHYFTIRGIYKSFPENSIFKGDLIASFISREKINPGEFKHWDIRGTRIYVQLNSQVNPKEFEEQLAVIYNKIKPDYEKEYNTKAILQPFKDIYLYSTDVQWDMVKKGDIKVVVGLGILAIFILLICIINYILMHTAMLSERMSTLEIHKIIGANQGQLVGQIFFETLVTIGIASILALSLIQLVLPWYNGITQLSLQLQTLFTPPFSLYILLGLISIFFLIIVHPIFFIFSISLRKRYSQKSIFGKQTLVSANIAVQFAFTIMMLIGSIILYEQIKLITEKTLGFDKEQLIVIDNPWDKEMGNRFQQFQNEISTYSFVKSVSGARNSPLENINNGGAFYPIHDEEKKINAGRVRVAPNFFELLGAKFISGNNFNPDFDLNKNSIIINETAYKELGIKHIIGEEIVYSNIREEAFTIVGVVEDIQHQSAHESSWASVYFPCNDEFYGLPNILVRLKEDNHQISIAELETVWKALAPQWPFSFDFMDGKINQVYAYEITSLNLLSKMTIVAIAISCLGIISFSMLTIEQRTKEIGIRKVVGAGVKDILVLLNKNYVKWIFIGFIAAIPVTWFAMEKWLENFAYKTEISWWMFLAAGGMAICIALLTVSWQTWRAASRNPVEALKSE